MVHPFPRRRLLAALILGLFLTSPAEAQPVVTSDDNAALRYLRATMLLSDATRDAADRLREDLVEPSFDPSPEDRRAIAQSSDVIELLLRGAAMPRCDFGIDWDLGPDALLPHLHHMRVAAHLLLADARLRAEAGEIEAAAARLAGAFRLASHTSQDHLLISSLVGVAVASQAAGVTKRLLDAGLLDPQGRRMVRDALGALASDDPFLARAAIAQEGRMMTAWLRQRINTAEGRRRVLEVMRHDDDATDNQAARLATTLALTDAQAHIDLLAAAYRQAAAAWDSDDPHRAYRALSEDLRSGAFGPLAGLFMPSFDRARRNSEEIQSRLDMLRHRLQE